MSAEIFIHANRAPIDIGIHVFPTVKYELIARALRDLGIPESRFGEPQEVAETDLSLVHTDAYLADLRAARVTERTIPSELPVSREVIEGFQAMVGGTLRAAKLAWDQERWTMHLGGGFHHAFADHAEGFCYFNDVAIAIRSLQKNAGLGRVAVIDTDLHQGNGTAAIFGGDRSVFTFSIHQERLYPVKERSDLDIGLDQFQSLLDNKELKEVILATNTTVEGEATAHYISEMVKSRNLKVTRIAHGVPMGG